MLLCNVARAGGREPENVDKESLVRVARVKGQQAVVDVLLGALALDADGDEPAGVVRVVADLLPQRLVVVVAVVDDDAPLAGDVLGTLGLDVLDGGRADHALGPGPVGLVVRAGALGRAGVEGVVPFRLAVAHLVDEVLA